MPRTVSIFVSSHKRIFEVTDIGKGTIQVHEKFQEFRYARLHVMNDDSCFFEKIDIKINPWLNIT